MEGCECESSTVERLSEDLGLRIYPLSFIHCDYLCSISKYVAQRCLFQSSLMFSYVGVGKYDVRGANI